MSISDITADDAGNVCVANVHRQRIRGDDIIMLTITLCDDINVNMILECIEL